MQGNWIKSSSWNTILDPLNGESFIKVAEVQEAELQVQIQSDIVLPAFFNFLSGCIKFLHLLCCWSGLNEFTAPLLLQFKCQTFNIVIVSLS